MPGAPFRGLLHQIWARNTLIPPFALNKVATARFMSSSQAHASVDAFLHNSTPSLAEQAEALRYSAHIDPISEDPLLHAIFKRADITNPGLLHAFFTAHPPPSTIASIKLLKEFNRRSSGVVPESIAMIPFRRAVYDANFGDAWKIMDQTRGLQSHWKAEANRKLRILCAIGLSVVLLVLLAVNALLQSGLVGEWDPSRSRMVLLMVATYLSALGIYGTLAFAGSKAGIGSVLEWAKGTGMITRFRNAPQLRMATLAAQLNRSLPENLGECAPMMLRDLSSHTLVVTESKSDQMSKEYWARGGDGYDWVEPDQDPADLLWRQKMQLPTAVQRRLKSPYIRTDQAGEPLSWENDVKAWREGRGVPHASLIDIDHLRSPDAMQQLESDLQKLSEERESHKINRKKLLSPKSDS